MTPHAIIADVVAQLEASVHHDRRLRRLLRDYLGNIHPGEPGSFCCNAPAIRIARDCDSLAYELCATLARMFGGVTSPSNRDLRRSLSDIQIMIEEGQSAEVLNRWFACCRMTGLFDAYVENDVGVA